MMKSHAAHDNRSIKLVDPGWQKHKYVLCDCSDSTSLQTQTYFLIRNQSINQLHVKKLVAQPINLFTSLRQ
jgi:hypothetical protein